MRGSGTRTRARPARRAPGRPPPPGRRASRTAVHLVWSLAVLVLAMGLLSGCGAGDEAHARRDFGHRGTRLTVESRNLALRIIPYDGDRITVDRWIRGAGLRGPEASWGLRGDTLRIALRCPGINFRCEGRADVRVPRTLTVDVDSANGSVRASGLRRPTHITSTEGEVTLTDIEGALTVRGTQSGVRVDRAKGDVRISTRNARITARRVDGTLHARTSNGTLSAEGISGDVDLRTTNARLEATALRGDALAYTTNGHLELRFAAPPAEVTGGSRNDDVRVRVPDDGTRYDVTGGNHNGRRSVEVPRAEAATGTDAGHRMALSTSNGNVSVGTED